MINLNPHLDKILDRSDVNFLRLVPGFDYRDYYVFKQIMTKEIEENLVAKMETAVEEAAYKEKIKNTEFEYPLRGVFKSWTKRRYTSKEKFDLGL